MNFHFPSAMVFVAEGAFSQDWLSTWSKFRGIWIAAAHAFMFFCVMKDHGADAELFIAVDTFTNLCRPAWTQIFTS